MNLKKMAGAWFKKKEVPGSAANILLKQNISDIEIAFLRNEFSSFIPPVEPDYLIEKNKNILNHSYDLLGLSRAEFDDNYLSTVRNFAKYVQLLPASEQHHHNGVGGLFRHSLEVSNAAIRRSTGVAFCGDLQGTARAKAKVRWPVAVGIAALSHDIGKAVYDIIVRSADGNDVWKPFDETLLDFAYRHNGYRVSWNSKRVHKQHEIVGMAIIDQIVTIDVRSWLTEGDSNILPTMLQAIGGFESLVFPVFIDVVREADKESTSRYQARPRKQSEDHISEINTGAHEASTAQPINSEAASEIACQDSNAIKEQPTVGGDNSVEFVSSIASDKVLNMLPELLAKNTLVVNRRDRERGVFWIDEETGTAWATYPALFNAFVNIFEEIDFRSYPKMQGSFFDMLELAGILSRTNNEVRSECKISINGKKAMTLSASRIVSSEVIALLQRYKDANCSVVNDSVEIDLEESELLAPSAVNKKNEVKQPEAELKSPPPSILKGNTPPPSLPKNQKDRTDAARGSGDSQVATNSTDEEQKDRRESIAQDNTLFSEYLNSLRNKKMQILNQPSPALSEDDGYDKEILKSLMCAILRERIGKDEWGVVDSSLYFVGSCVPGVVGDSLDNVIASLFNAERLILDGDSVDVDVKASGVCSLAINNQAVICIVLSAKTTKFLLEAFELKLESLRSGDVALPKLKIVAQQTESTEIESTEISTKNIVFKDVSDKSESSKNNISERVESDQSKAKPLAPKSIHRINTPKAISKSAPPSASNNKSLERVAIEPKKPIQVPKGLSKQKKDSENKKTTSAPNIVAPQSLSRKDKKAKQPKRSDDLKVVELDSSLREKLNIPSMSEGLIEAAKGNERLGVDSLDVTKEALAEKGKNISLDDLQMVKDISEKVGFNLEEAVSVDGLLHTLDVYLEAKFDKHSEHISIVPDEFGEDSVCIGGLPRIFRDGLCRDFTFIKFQFLSRVVGLPNENGTDQPLPKHLVRKTKNMVYIKKEFLTKTYQKLLNSPF